MSTRIPDGYEMRFGKLQRKPLTDEQIYAIKKALTSTCECCGTRATQNMIAIRFNIHRSVVAHIAAGHGKYANYAS